MSACNGVTSHFTKFLKPVSYQHFTKLCMLIGRAVSVEPNPKAKIPAFLLELTFGEELEKVHRQEFKKERFKSSAQLCARHKKDEIEGNLLMSIVNFPRKQIGNLMSDCLVTGAQIPEGSPEEKRATTVFLQPTVEVPPGTHVGITGTEEKVVTIARDLTWGDFQAVDLRIGTVRTFTFEPMKGSLMRLKGEVSLGPDGSQKPFVGIVDKDFELREIAPKQLMFWVNPEPKEISEIFGEGTEDIDSECAVLCTCDAGKAGIKPAIPVENGYRIA